MRHIKIKAKRFEALNKRACRAMSVFENIKAELVATIEDLRGLESDMQKAIEEYQKMTNDTSKQISEYTKTLKNIESIIG